MPAGPQNGWPAPRCLQHTATTGRGHGRRRSRVLRDRLPPPHRAWREHGPRLPSILKPVFSREFVEFWQVRCRSPEAASPSSRHAGLARSVQGARAHRACAGASRARACTARACTAGLAVAATTMRHGAAFCLTRGPAHKLGTIGANPIHVPASFQVPADYSSRSAKRQCPRLDLLCSPGTFARRGEGALAVGNGGVLGTANSGVLGGPCCAPTGDWHTSKQ